MYICSNRFLNRRCLRLGMLIGGLLPVISQAAVLEEITVVAQKREQNIQDVGISISAFSGEQLNALGVTNTVDISQQVPALQYQQFSPAFTILNLRGISQNNFTDNLEAPVAVYIDGTYSASMNAVSAQLFDIERVEVLRGPQGTLFGRNATGGLVHYITRGANEQALNGYIEGSFSDYDKRSFEGALGGAVSETVRGRIAVRWEKADGYVESENNLVRDQFGADGYALRGALQVDFTDGLQGDFKLSFAKDEDVPAGAFTTSIYPVPGTGFDPATGFGLNTGLVHPHDPHTHDSDHQGYFDREMIDAGATFTLQLNDNMELVSITNWKSLDKFYTEDSDGGQNPFSFVFSPQADFEQISQEVRLSGATDRTRWQVGAYYLKMDYDMETTVTDPPFPGYRFLGGPFEASITQIDLDSQNWSVFGQVEYDLTESVTAIVGFRWSQDDKEIDWVVHDRLVGTGTLVQNPGSLAALLPGNPGLDTIDYSDYAARAQLNWTPGNDVLFFLSFNRGIKGGNWTPPVTADPTVVLKHDEETLYAYELGAKLSFLQGAARLNATGFYYDYRDYQAFSFNGSLTPQVSNSDATAWGGEIELFLSPYRSLDIILGASFIDSEVDEVPTVFGGKVEAEFPSAPGLSLNWLGRYEWPLAGGNVAAQIDGNYNDSQYLLGTNAPVSKEAAYTVWNASLSYTTSDEKWRATFWVKNLTDEEYRVYHLDLALAGMATDIYAPPRWLGGTVRYRW